MTAFHQMGHHSENLLYEQELDRFAGAILSPVNYQESEVRSQVLGLRERSSFQAILDPQLYFPRTERSHLREWSYFPTDFDSTDLSSEAWWRSLVRSLAETARSLQPTATCSPAVVARSFNDEYFAGLVGVGRMLLEELAGSEIEPVQTAIVQLSDLAIPTRSLSVASILSATPCTRIYLVFLNDTNPRRERSDTEELKGAMQLISALEEAGISLLVGFCSSDVVLWKAAGATACATGKFFNLRRFTKSRFEEPAGGGGQLAYWFEESLLGFLRESDLTRIRMRDLLSAPSQENPFGQRILRMLEDSPGEAWLALGWRQFMYWFADIERRIEAGEADPGVLLRQAERNWLDLEDSFVLMEEPRNDGSWLRAWRRALVEFSNH